MVVVPTSSVTESWHRNQENFSTTREKKGSAIYGLSRRVLERYFGKEIQFEKGT